MAGWYWYSGLPSGLSALGKQPGHEENGKKKKKSGHGLSSSGLANTRCPFTVALQGSGSSWSVGYPWDAPWSALGILPAVLS